MNSIDYKKYNRKEPQRKNAQSAAKKESFGQSLRFSAFSLRFSALKKNYSSCSYKVVYHSFLTS